VPKHATKAYGGIVPDIFKFVTVWVTGVTFTFPFHCTRQKSFRWAINVPELSVWTIGGTDKSPHIAGTRTALYRLPKSQPTFYFDCSRIVFTKSQPFCMVNSFVCLTDLAVLLSQSCEGSCYVVHSSN
jgi:hypothetical protein